MRLPIIMIASFPPPVSGQSLAAELLKNGLSVRGYGRDDLIELNLAESIGGDGFLKRLGHLIGLECRLFVQCLRCGPCIVYLQLGHGKAALLRDLVFMSTAVICRRALAVHVHGSGFRRAFDGLPWAVREIERSVLKKIRAAVVLSPSLRRMFEGILDDNRIFAIDNGIDPDFVHMTEDMPARTYSRELRILFLSNFLTAKGFSTLLRCAEIAQNAHKPWKFHFVGAKIPGQDVDIDSFKAEKALENIEISEVLLGRDKHQAYQEADVFVLPSEYEGQPLCILEALFEGLPVVTARVGGIPEIFSSVPDAERCVRYVEPSNPMQIFEVLSALDNDRESLRAMGQSSRALALARFTAERHVEKMCSIFSEMEHGNL